MRPFFFAPFFFDTPVTALYRPGEGVFPISTKPTTPIGWREYVDLPGLSLEHVPAKIDTGAKTSALHVDTLEPHDGPDGEPMVRLSFRVRHNLDEEPEQVHVDLPVAGTKKVMSSNGEYEERPFIRTVMKLGGRTIKAAFTLTNRGSMRYPILVGRSAMRGRYEIHPGESFIHGTRDAELLVHSDDERTGEQQ
ncbi:RimK/LysX family protein [Sphingomonadaceae bacterium]|nr:RimK/LysX family protein [Sphingomonadaceae bacterium]